MLLVMIGLANSLIALADSELGDYQNGLGKGSNCSDQFRCKKKDIRFSEIYKKLCIHVRYDIYVCVCKYIYIYTVCFFLQEDNDERQQDLLDPPSGPRANDIQSQPWKSVQKQHPVLQPSSFACKDSTSLPLVSIQRHVQC